MQRVIRTSILLVAAAAALVGSAFVANPERARLTDGNRRGVAGQFITLHDGTVHFQLLEASGASRRRRGIVVLVHGCALPYHVWDSTVAGLNAAGYTTLRYDLFGRGFSDRPPAAYDADFYVRQLAELLDSLRLREPVNLVGVSTGGWVTASFVARHPERVRTLALIDPIADRPAVPWVMRLPLIGPLLFQSAGVRWMASQQTENFLHPERFREFTRDFMQEAHFRGFGRALRSTALILAQTDFDSVYAEADRMGGPVLLLWGRQDRTMPFLLSRRLRRAIPRLELVAVDSARHLPQLERAAAVNAGLVAFLDRTSAVYRQVISQEYP